MMDKMDWHIAKLNEKEKRAKWIKFGIKGELLQQTQWYHQGILWKYILEKI